MYKGYGNREGGLVNVVITVTIKNCELKFKTSDIIFSPKSIDDGTLAMLSKVDFQKDDKVLDLGCGYGVVGILAAKLCGSDKIVMTDICPEAIRLAEYNVKYNGVEGVRIYQSDGFKDFKEKDFSLILSNPPYHVDFAIAKHFVEKGFNRLKIGGKMFMVTKRKEWYKNKLIAIFGGVRVWEIDGYFVFMSEKKNMNYSKK